MDITRSKVIGTVEKSRYGKRDWRGLALDLIAADVATMDALTPGTSLEYRGYWEGATNDTLGTHLVVSFQMGQDDNPTPLASE